MALRALFTVIAVACIAGFARPQVALAVDRAVGADVPKPTVTGAPWTDAEISSLAANVDLTLAGAKTLRGAHVGVYAIDARDGRVVYERNQDDLFQPASTFKLLVGSAALDRLGPAFRFHTELVATGAVEGGRLPGGLVLRGGGDPFLSMNDLDAAAAAVAAAGVRSVGDVTIDDTRYEAPGYRPGWNWDDFSFYYAPVVSGLSFEENVVHLTVSPGASEGARATVIAAPIGRVGVPVEGCAPTVAVQVVPEATTGAPGSKDTIDVERAPSGCIRVTGTIPLDGKPDVVNAAVPSPARYAYDALVAALTKHGVAATRLETVAGPWPSSYEHRIVPVLGADARVLWAHDSEPLSDVLADMWLPSDNLVAELLLQQVGFAESGAPGTSENGIAYEKTWLRGLGVDPDALAISDGSGLSTYDRISPVALVTILAHDWNGPSRDLVLDALPIAGVRGTLRSSFKGTSAEGHVFAKTGSISHVSTLAGYAGNAKHGAVIFAFQVDDWVGASADLRELRGRVLSHFVDD